MVRERETPFDDEQARFSAGVLGMWILLAVLAVLFVAAILGYLAVRIDNGSAFIPANAPSLPLLLLVSTAFLVLSSLTMQMALRAARTGGASQGRMMMATLGLALGFLVVQALAWRGLLAEDFGPTGSLYAWTFFVLTALHGAHVVGGLPPMVITTWRASRGAYTPENHRGIAYCAMYWHFLDGAWLVLYATIWLGSIR
ncbi:MAG: heme-copper oxidase subunit III [Planctomycetota bacterium]|jgi:cytochrome c oxidase subunit 3|nr:MAG: heme-copper oxidase subunit III [Planctomycetota bacterium]RLT00008.1 MAG: heme-copper oxidase subunit III [Planctomycetota bacterium]